MVKLRQHGTRTWAEVRIRQTGAGSSISIPKAMIRALDWRFGYVLSMALIRMSPEIARDRQRRGDYTHLMRRGSGNVDAIDALRFEGLAIAHDDTSAPIIRRRTRREREDEDKGVGDGVGVNQFADIHHRQLRVTQTAFMVTIPKQHMRALRWHDGDRMMLILCDDGIVVSKIDE